MNPRAIINEKEYRFIKTVTDIITNRTAVLCEDEHGCSFICDSEIWQRCAVKPKTEFNKYASPNEKIELFKSLFIGREDVYAKRLFNAKTGKSGYVPVCANEWVQGVCDKKKYKCNSCPSKSFAYNELIKDTNIVRSMSRAGKPTDNPVNESLNGWIKEELFMDFHIDDCRKREDVRNTLENYVRFYNEKRPCYAIGYDTPVNYRKRFYKGELEPKNTFADRVLSEEPKFVRKRRSKAISESVSTLEKENC